VPPNRCCQSLTHSRNNVNKVHCRDAVTGHAIRELEQFASGLALKARLIKVTIKPGQPFVACQASHVVTRRVGKHCPPQQLGQLAAECNGIVVLLKIGYQLIELAERMPSCGTTSAGSHE
jgi:hypothetical protein